MEDVTEKIPLAQRGRSALRNAALYLAVGYVLFFASERLFWSTFRAGDHLGDLLITWLAYSALACVLLNVVVRLRADTAPRVFLAGALYGWLTEGTLVGTLYGTEASAPFPLSLVWTGLSWHALISVLVFCHGLPWALTQRTAKSTLLWSAAVGAYWGTWATFLWRETPPEVSPVSVFAAHALVGTGLLLASYAVVRRFPLTGCRPGWTGLILSLLVLGIFYSAQVKALGLRPLLVLPSLIGAVLSLLWWAGRGKPVTPGVTEQQPIQLRNLPVLLVMPLTATALYAGQRALDLPGIAPIHFYRVGGIVAVGILGWSVYRLVRDHFGKTAGPTTTA